MEPEFMRGDTVAHVTTGRQFFVDIDHDGKVCNDVGLENSGWRNGYAVDYYEYIVRVSLSRMILSEIVRPWRSVAA